MTADLFHVERQVDKLGGPDRIRGYCHLCDVYLDSFDLGGFPYVESMEDYLDRHVKRDHAVRP